MKTADYFDDQTLMNLVKENYPEATFQQPVPGILVLRTKDLGPVGISEIQEEVLERLVAEKLENYQLRKGSEDPNPQSIQMLSVTLKNPDSREIVKTLKSLKKSAEEILSIKKSLQEWEEERTAKRIARLVSEFDQFCNGREAKEE